MSKYENDPFYEKKFYVWKSSVFDDVVNEWKFESPDSFEVVEAFLKDVCKKHPINEYLVVNQDETYADDVWKIITENSKKEIVAFVGRAGSGKDYQSDLLVQKGYKKMSFANALRKIAFKCFGITLEEGIGIYDYLKANDCITLSLPEEDIKINFRQFLEFLGTQGIRAYDEDFWVNCLIKDIKEANVKKICISDLRFTNEFIKLKRFAEDNGYIFRCIFCDYHSDRYQENNTHDSAALSNYLATHGYKDLEEILWEDCCGYLGYKRELEFGT